MKAPENAAVSLMRWCTRQTWDVLLMLFVGPGATATDTNRHFGEWIREVERAVGASEFRWARLFAKNEGEVPTGFFVLIGGTKAEDLSSWRSRWSVISGAPPERYGPGYSFQRQGKRARSLLRSLLEEGDFAMEVHIGRA